MGAEKEGLSIKEKRRAREELITQALGEFNSNILGLLVTKTRWTRFMKLIQREDGSWLAIAGVVSEDDENVVCFGNGRNALGALHILGRAMANDEWRVDKYSKRS